MKVEQHRKYWCGDDKDIIVFYGRGVLEIGVASSTCPQQGCSSPHQLPSPPHRCFQVVWCRWSTSRNLTPLIKIAQTTSSIQDIEEGNTTLRDNTVVTEKNWSNLPPVVRRIINHTEREMNEFSPLSDRQLSSPDFHIIPIFVIFLLIICHRSF